MRGRVRAGVLKLSKVHELSWRRAALTALAVVIATFGSSAPQAGQYEQPPSFSAGQTLPPNLLRSENYTVGHQVGLDNFQYVFRVDTRWGPFTVKGADLMRVRAREMAATAELAKIDSAGTFVNAAGRTALKPIATAKDLVTAPARTIGDTFKGVGNLFGSVDASMAATDPHKEKLIPSLTGGATARRKLAYDFGVDPKKYRKLSDTLDVWFDSGSPSSPAAPASPSASAPPATRCGWRCATRRRLNSRKKGASCWPRWEFPQARWTRSTPTPICRRPTRRSSPPP